MSCTIDNSYYCSGGAHRDINIKQIDWIDVSATTISSYFEESHTLFVQINTLFMAALSLAPLHLCVCECPSWRDARTFAVSMGATPHCNAMHSAMDTLSSPLCYLYPIFVLFFPVASLPNTVITLELELKRLSSNGPKI